MAEMLPEKGSKLVRLLFEIDWGREIAVGLGLKQK